MKRHSGRKRMVAGLAVGVAILAAAAAHADPLDSADFTSLGANPFTATGTYTVDTAATPPVLTKPDSSTINGQVSGGIAVFTFDSISIAAGMTVAGIRNVGSRPLALLSDSDFSLAAGAIIDVSGGNGSDGTRRGVCLDGGNGGNAGPGGGGGGGGAKIDDAPPRTCLGTPGSGGVGFENGNSGSAEVDSVVGGDGGSVEMGGGGHGGFSAGGGAFGGNGGNSLAGVAGGTAYGDLAVLLEGGSGGGGGTGGGGGGGGALELGASGDISLAGNVIATGGSGGSNRGGGAAGGAILVHGTSATLSGSLNASGGAGIAFSGGGGGGRVLILTGSGALDAGSLAANVNVSGGTAGPPFGEPGQAGVKELGQLATPASMIGDLTDTVNGLSGVPSGIKRSLVAKLNAALAALDAGDAATACSNLKAFINATNAQKGKKLTAAQADALITQATAIRTALGCS